jgi:hypothetical protein
MDYQNNFEDMKIGVSSLADELVEAVHIFIASGGTVCTQGVNGTIVDMMKYFCQQVQALNGEEPNDCWPRWGERVTLD